MIAQAQILVAVKDTIAKLIGTSQYGCVDSGFAVIKFLLRMTIQLRLIRLNARPVINCMYHLQFAIVFIVALFRKG
ncbi:MAG: hypothetical protein WDO19_00110 [Bacteroidota bacterium]